MGLGEKEILAEFSISHQDGDEEQPIHQARAHFEHDQWWVMCSRCGASWSVVETVSTQNEEGIGFEEIDQGDGYCEDTK